MHLLGPYTHGGKRRRLDQPDNVTAPAHGTADPLARAADGLNTAAISSRDTRPPTNLDDQPASPRRGEKRTLQFNDGACRGHNAKEAGAGAILLRPGGDAAWTASVHLEGVQTNNTAEYQALLAGVDAARAHGCNVLRIEGDSALVIAQIKGEFSTKNKRLRRYRNQIRRGLETLGRSSLVHIDRMANQVADRLANKALDSRRTSYECADHGIRTMACPTAAEPPPSPTRPEQPAPDPMSPQPSYQDRSLPGPPVDDVESFPTIATGPDSVPQPRPRLRLRKLTENESQQASKQMTTLARRLLTRLREATSWDDGEGLLCTIAPSIYDALAQFAQPPHRRSHRRYSSAPEVPPSTDDSPGAQHFRARLDGMRAAQRDPTMDRRSVNRARRATGRARRALDREQLRRRFDRDESGCVRSILSAAATSPSDIATAEATDSTCPLPADDVYGYFEGLHTPQVEFDFDAPCGEPFRDRLRSLPPPTKAADVLSADISMEDVEDMLLRVRRHTAPGHDGIGYDILHRFKTELLPLLHEAYSFCWSHRRIPATWKVGVIKLVHKKGSRTVPSNWRPLCLQPTLYKLYASILARRLSAWLEVNDRLTPEQKGFRAMNGCNEHNFMAAMALDDARRRSRALYMVWYDLKNAFGAIPPALIWRTMAAIDVDADFITCCQGIYTDSYYTVVNTATGATPPIQHRLGVYQGCPLSPFLFLVGVMPLVRRLHELPTAGVRLAEDVMVRATAFADDIKGLSATKEGIEAAHQVVQEFLEWSTMAANPTKCATFGTCMAGRRRQEDPPQLKLHGERIPPLSMAETYRYLGVGDGFDHSVTDFQLDAKLKELKGEAAALLRSGLRPSQIVKALKVHVYSKLEYAFRHVRVPRASLERWDAWLRRGLRHLLRLPQAASTAFFYAPTSHGGLGLLPLTDQLAAIQVGHAWQMLHAPDLAVASTARAQVAQIAQRRYRLDAEHWKDRQDDLVVAFLQGTLESSPHATRYRQSHDITSLWTEVQGHVKRLVCCRATATADQPHAVEADDDAPTPPETPTLATPTHPDPLERRNVMAQLKLHAKRRYVTTWKAQHDQGVFTAK
ncbi:LOW QUALITY PROTEIN: Reverse transcriptase [Phytophthora palmivora]|uniref:Reverse transcriptase n=1 Tax=Phytophthora palmivora TaxID=4796 RepID=A0A2P4XH02_9STRA|nr:LOW QUALITY PROTEIN: Reverse transcriptase [Phytophthora palmivora]